MDFLGAGRNFNLLSRRTQMYITQACKPYGITYSEFVILLALYEEDRCSQEQLGKRMCADKGFIAHNVKLLEEKNYVVRYPDKKDKRVRRIYITEKGNEHKALFQQMSLQWIKLLTVDMTEEECEQTIRYLAIVAKRAAQTAFVPERTEGMMSDE